MPARDSTGSLCLVAGLRPPASSALFGLFAPRNATVVFALLLGALSVSAAIFLILELDRPFGGLIQISSVLLRNAVARLGQ